MEVRLSILFLTFDIKGSRLGSRSGCEILRNEEGSGETPWKDENLWFSSDRSRESFREKKGDFFDVLEFFNPQCQERITASLSSLA